MERFDFVTETNSERILKGRVILIGIRILILSFKNNRALQKSLSHMFFLPSDNGMYSQ